MHFFVMLIFGDAFLRDADLFMSSSFLSRESRRPTARRPGGEARTTAPRALPSPFWRLSGLTISCRKSPNCYCPWPRISANRSAPEQRGCQNREKKERVLPRSSRGQDGRKGTSVAKIEQGTRREKRNECCQDRAGDKTSSPGLAIRYFAI